jgi:crotonobetainyl-CoA:carnitine CoA-transferase CaiB-like acyl-CoA transferase
VSVIDFSAGILSTLALMIGLHQARRTGVGCDLDVSLYDSALAMLNYLAGWTLNRDWKPQRTADGAHQTLVPAQTFATADGHLVVMCLKEKFWRRLCERMERLDLRDDPRFATFAERYRNRAVLVPVLAADFRARSTAAWLERLRGAVPCGPVYSVDEALADEHAIAREMVVGLDHPQFGWLRQVGTPVKIAGVTPVYRRAPRLGEHTDEILAELGGYDTGEIAELHAAGVV